MLALAMVVAASLVGAPGLGQDVLIALGEGNAGRGLVAGFCIAALAIVFDRIPVLERRAEARLGLVWPDASAADASALRGPVAAGT